MMTSLQLKLLIKDYLIVYKCKYNQAGAALGQAQLKLGLGFTLV